MKTLPTPRLLGFLIEKGYKYCLFETTCINQHKAYAGITLKPVKKHPLLQNLLYPFNACYSIIREPLQMATGLANTLILVELGFKKFEVFEKSLKEFNKITTIKVC